MNKKIQLHLNPKALSDLETIYHYSFQEWGIDQAERYQDEIYDGMNRIVSHPKIGRSFIFELHNYRIFTVKSHSIYYRLNENQIFITRILHKSMDRKKHL